MALPLQPPIEPQLARGKPGAARGDGWSYEPKYDGFRALAFVDGEELLLQSRGAKPLQRYFPELRFPPGRYVLDGEIVIDAKGGPEGVNGLRTSMRSHSGSTRPLRGSSCSPADAGPLRRLRSAGCR